METNRVVPNEWRKEWQRQCYRFWCPWILFWTDSELKQQLEFPDNRGYFTERQRYKRKKHSKYSEYIKEIKRIEMLNVHVQMQTKSRPNSIHGKTSTTFTSDLLLTFIDFFSSTICSKPHLYIYHPCWILWSLHTLSLLLHMHRIYLHLHFAYSSHPSVFPLPFCSFTVGI